MKYLLPSIVSLILLVNPLLVSYGAVQDKTYKLPADGYIQGSARMTCVDQDGEPEIHVRVDITKAFHLKGPRLMSAFIVDLTKNGPESYIQIGKPQVPIKEYDYIAFSGSFDSKNFQPEESELEEKSAGTVGANSMRVFVNTDKKEYDVGESAVVFFAFIDADDNFIDPDSINASFNGMPIDDLLERKKAGSFTYMTSPLQQGHSQIMVSPSKAGFDRETGTVTIATKGSVNLAPAADTGFCPIGHMGRIVVVVGTSPPSDGDTLSKGDVDIIAATTSGTAETGVF